MPEYDLGERFDLKGPYVDNGWVDEEADVMGVGPLGSYAEVFVFLNINCNQLCSRSTCGHYRTSPCFPRRYMSADILSLLAVLSLHLPTAFLCCTETWEYVRRWQEKEKDRGGRHGGGKVDSDEPTTTV
jgi:hypothetical protein